MTHKPEVMSGESLDIAAQRRNELKQLFPGVFTETKDAAGNVVSSIDFERLKAELGTFSDIYEGRRERYGMEWPGKRDCMKVIQETSRATLKPCPDESVNWDTTKNLFIEGDNLEVLKLLQKSYYGKVKMIYIDPPYNTGNEFIYPDNYQETLDTYLAYAGLLDDDGKTFTTNTASEGRFHSKWMNMMYPRLYLGKNLLRSDGVAFISIGQDELHDLLLICNDIFGEENLISICSRVMKTGGNKGIHFSPCVDYVLIYAKSIAELNQFREPISQNVIDKVYTKIETEGERKGQKYRTMGLYQAMLDKRANQRYYIECPDGSLVIPPGDSFPSSEKEGEQIKPGDGDGVWRWTYARFAQEKSKGNVEFIKSDKTSLVDPQGKPASWNIYYKIWLNDRLEEGQLPGNILDKFESRHASSELKALDIPFDFPKPSSLIKFFMSICGMKEGDTVMDFFAGSGSTAHAALELSQESGENYHFICVQLPEKTNESSDEFKRGYKNLADISKERIRRVIKKFKGENQFVPLDIGFKAFSLSPSNFVSWRSTGITSVDELNKQFEFHLDNINSDDKDSLLYELLLKAGFELGCEMSKTQIAEKTVYSIANGALLICLEDRLTTELIDEVISLEPMQFICLDKGFQGNDQLKANTAQAFKAHSQNSEAEMVFKVV